MITGIEGIFSFPLREATVEFSTALLIVQQ